MTKKEIASYIDHTLLAPQATVKQIILLCKEAIRYGFASVCVNPSYVSVAYTELAESNVKVCTVVGFPLGATTSVDTTKTSVEIPPLTTNRSVVTSNSTPGKKTQTPVKHTNRGYALGGSMQGNNLFVTGGPEDNTPTDDGTKKVQLAPGLIQMLDQMNDSAYNAFIAEQAHTPSYTTAQRDSV